MERQAQHTERVRCIVCNTAMDIPITVLIDIELDNRTEGCDLGGVVCEACL